MNTQTFHDILRSLEELGSLYATMRFGQLVAMVTMFVGEEAPVDVSEVEDDQFLAATRAHVTRRRAQLAGHGLPANQFPGPLRRELLDRFAVFGTLQGGCRFGQLTTALAASAGINLYDLEDEQLLATIERDREKQPAE